MTPSKSPYPESTKTAHLEGNLRSHVPVPWYLTLTQTVEIRWCELDLATSSAALKARPHPLLYTAALFELTKWFKSLFQHIVVPPLVLPIRD